jgi:predicted nucleic acid-binding protein
MIGLDCNILVQLAFADHPANRATLAAIENEARHGPELVFPSLVITEFLHVITDARRFSPPLTMSAALEWVDELLTNPTVAVLETTTASVAQMLRWMQQYNLGRKRILDTHLAAILHTSGATRLLTSNPADFAIFGVFEIIVPAPDSGPPAS